MNSPFGLDHLSEDFEVTTGGSNSWGEVISQGFEQQFRVDSPLSLENEIDNRWRETLEVLRQRTGEDFQDVNNFKVLGDYARESFGETAAPPSPAEAKFYNQQREALEKADARIRELGDPELQSFSDIVREVVRMQQEIERGTTEQGERGGLGTDIGHIIGGIGGAFTIRDPVSLFSLPLGGLGRTAVRRIAGEMGIGAAAAGAAAPSVQENRAFADLPDRGIATDIIVGALGAGAFQGVAELLGAGLRRALRPREGKGELALDFSDDQLSQMLETRPESPRARAGISVLDDVQFVERNNPYGGGRTADARFIAELQDIQRVLGGAPDTAIARVLPPMPFEEIERTVDFQVVKEQSPAVYAKLEEAQARVVDLDSQIAAVATRLEEIDIVGAVRLVDEDAANELATLQQRVNDPAIPEPERVAADIEGQAIINRVGVEKIEKKFNEQSNRARETTKRLRASRRSANRQYRTAYREVEAEVGKIKAFQRAYKGKQEADTVDLLGNVMGGRTFVGSALTRDMVERQMMRVTELAEVIDEQAVGIIHLPEAEDGRIDIGLEEPVDPNFKVLTEDGDLSVRQIMDDLLEDEKLDEAMRTCLI